MKLFSVTVLYHFNVVAETHQAAWLTGMAAAKAEDTKPFEARAQVPLAGDQLVHGDETPYVADEIDDAALTKLSGKSSATLRGQLNVSEPKKL